MKKIKLMLTSFTLMMTVITVGATHTAESTSPESTVVKQCGVTNAQIASYLRNCSHHHVPGAITDIPGTCNSSVAIENCLTSIVYVADGYVIGHADSGISCE